MRKYAPVLLTAALAIGFQAISASAEKTAGEADFTYQVGENGLVSLRWGTNEFIKPGEGAYLKVTAAGSTPRNAPLQGAPVAQGQNLKYAFEGAEANLTYKSIPNGVSLRVSIRNMGNEALTDLVFRPFVLNLPRRPEGSIWVWGYENCIEPGSPQVITADWGRGELVLSAEPGDPKLGTGDYALGLNSKKAAEVFLRPKFDPPLAPGSTWTGIAEFRAAPSGTPATTVAAKTYSAFAQKYPFVLNFPDRRPIGALFMANSGRHWPNNPRGWFNESNEDYLSEAGKAKFRERLMKFADNSISIARDTGAQGLLVWDVEGGEMPHAITYLGDPRVLPQCAPEMDAVADEFFSKIRDAGLRTGICIRPSKVIPDPKGGWKHQQVDDVLENLADKISYAKKRWGCTMFYMDTNVTWPIRDDGKDLSRGMWQGNATVLSTDVICALQKRFPEALIFPEFHRFGYYSAASHYAELKAGYTNTPDEVRRVYPNATSVITIGDGDYQGNWEKLRAGVQGGDIHLFRSWFADSPNLMVKRLYEEAEFLRALPNIKKTGALETLLADPDPKVRFAAVDRLGKATSAQVPVLSRALAKETSWPVQHWLLESLGNSGQSEALPTLLEYSGNKKSGMDGLAVLAMGRLGPPATEALLRIASGKDARLAEMALRALALNNDAAATQGLLLAANGTNTNFRVLALEALVPRSSATVVQGVLPLLQDKESRVVIATARLLGRSGDKSSVAPLIETLVRSVTTTRNNDIRLAAAKALEQLTGEQFGVNEGQWKKALDAGQLQ